METELFNELLSLTDLKGKELSDKMLVSQQQLSMWKTGKKIPKLSTLRNLANVLGYKLTINIESK